MSWSSSFEGGGVGGNVSGVDIRFGGGVGGGGGGGGLLKILQAMHMYQSPLYASQGFCQGGNISGDGGLGGGR